MKLSDNMRGLAWMALAAAAWSFMQAISREVMRTVHPFEVVFFRQFLGTFILVPWCIRHGIEPLRTKRLGLHVAQAAIYIAGVFSLFYGLTIVPLAQVSALRFSVPVFTAVLATFVLREKAELQRWAIIFINFFGVFITLIPGLRDSGTIDSGSIFVLLSSLSTAISLILIKMLNRTEGTVAITIYFTVITAFISLVPALAVWQWPTWNALGALFVVAALGLIGQQATVLALRKSETHVVMPIDFTKLVWAALLGYVWFAEIPTAYVLLGGTIIFGANLYGAWREYLVRR